MHHARIAAVWLTVFCLSAGTSAPGQPPAKPADAGPPAAGAADAPEVFKQSLARIAASIKDDSIARCMSYYLARLALLDKIAENVPSLRSQAADANAKFAVAFGAGFDELLREFLSRGSDRIDLYNKLRADAVALAIKQPLDEAELTKAFAAGALNPDAQAFKYVHLLLVMHPGFQRHPERVFQQNFAATVPLALKDGPPVATVRIPTTFALISGKDDHETLSFAFASSGPATITLTISPTTAPLTPPQAVQNLVAGAPPTLTPHGDRARFLEIAVGAAALVPMDMSMGAGQAGHIARGAMLLVPTRDCLIGIAASVQVAKGPNQDAQADELLSHFQPLFDLVRASLAPARTD